MKKEITILVPGAYDLTTYPIPIQIISKFLARIFGIDLALTDQVKTWKKTSHFQGNEFVWMHWSRGIDGISKYFAKKKLKHLLEHYKNEKINLVGVSLGGDIILETLQKSSQDNINKIVLVGSINENKKISFPHNKIFNIYSEKDNFAKLAINFYSPILGGIKLEGKKIKNILLPKIKHDDFCKDSKIKSGKFKGKSITQLITSILIS